MFITFRSGWKDFVTANDIEANEILVSRYSGDALFQVLIFDTNGCERISSFSAKEVGKEVQEISNASIKVLDRSDPNMHQDQDKITISCSSSEFYKIIFAF